ncbi:MAG TPA: hypothetical protein VF363_03900 [Candidatus Eisenbacteria bacterium]
MPRSILAVAFACHLALAASPPGVSAGLLSLSIVGGATTLDGATEIAEPVAQESLSGSTLAQLAAPLLFDPEGFLGLTVRITNVSDRDLAFPDALPGVSVLTGVVAVTGYSSKLNVASGGAAGKSGAAGAEGGVSRTALDLTGALEATSSPVVGSNGGGGGAATGVAENWIAATGASGAELAAWLAGLTLRPGEWIDVPDFVRITAFGRSSSDARIALGFDLPTFSYGGVSVTSGAWTGEFAGPADRGGGGEVPASVPEPPGAWTTGAALAGLLLRGRRARAVEQGGE